jgi:hypothetical protein
MNIGLKKEEEEVEEQHGGDFDLLGRWLFELCGGLQTDCNGATIHRGH